MGGDRIRGLKEKLKAQGLSGKKINDNEEIKALVAELNELKSTLPADGGAAAVAQTNSQQKGAASPKAGAKSPKGSPKSGPKESLVEDVEAKIKAVGDEIRDLKEKLKAEGLSGKKVNDHAEV